MVIWEPLDLRLQNDQSTLVPIKVLHKVGEGIPDIVRVRIDGRKYIEKVLDIYILRLDPL